MNDHVLLNISTCFAEHVSVSSVLYTWGSRRNAGCLRVCPCLVVLHFFALRLCARVGLYITFECCTLWWYFY